MRSQRQVPDIYFGRPGQLVKLPWPASGIDKPYERQTYDFLTGSGLHQVSSLSVGSRPFQLNWDALHLDTFRLLEQYRIGANGPGPFVLIDPSAPNLLPTNVGSATGLYNNGTQFDENDGIVGANQLPQWIHRTNGWRSIRWRFTSTPVQAFPTISMQSMYRNWYGQPVVPTLPYTFSSWITPDVATDPSITIGMRITWLDIAGATISTSASADTAITTWTRLSVTGTAPAGAAYAKPIWVLTGTSIALGTYLYIDEPIFEQDSAVNDWAMSSGIRPVEIVGLTESVPFEARFRTPVQMSLRELAQ